jgi:glutamate 5-kinase
MLTIWVEQYFFMKPPVIVIKIGTSSLTRPDGKLALATIATLIETIADLKHQGYSIILVSSGAVGVGCTRLNLTTKPRLIALKQAAAAVGQGRLIRVYDDLFSQYGLPVAQILLTRSDLEKRQGYKNIYNTLQELLKLNVVPIINENDTVAVEELKFGDNDTLSARVASLVEAKWLFLLTDVDHLYSDDPRQNPNAKTISIVESIAELEVKTGTQGSQWGTGGMVTKITAAKIAVSAGVNTVITNGQKPQNISKILAGESIGTHFLAQAKIENFRKRWIAHGSVPIGKICLDPGAVQAIVKQGKSLLPVGITGISGSFDESDTVQLCDNNMQEIAIGIVNYNSNELHQIHGHQSTDIENILGYIGEETVVHRDNLVLT